MKKGIIISFLLSTSTAKALVKNDLISLKVHSSLDTRLANIHVQPRTHISHPIIVTYGSCENDNFEDSCHQEISRYGSTNSSGRLIWVIPQDAPNQGCLSAWSGIENILVGRSEGLFLKKKEIVKRSSPRPFRSFTGIRNESEIDSTVTMGDYGGIDASGPWFDGVAAITSNNKNLSIISVEEAKQKHIAIIGGGMSGLLTSMILDSVGIHNWEIVEASGRLGGRIRTEYFDQPPSAYQYQEMGPMRFPEEIFIAKQNVTLQIKDHKLVFDLAEKLNVMNKNRPDLHIKFIPWIESTPNNFIDTGGFTIDGGIPTVGQLSNLNTTHSTNPFFLKAQNILNELETSPEVVLAAAESVFDAHKAFIENGWDNWSEFAFLHNYLKYDLNITDQIASDGLGYGGTSTALSLWGAIYEGVYFAATSWKTVDQGLQRIPDAFYPRVENRTIFNRSIERLSFNTTTHKVTLSWRNTTLSRSIQSKDYDYAFVAAPFSVVRSWKLPQFSTTLTNAIHNLNYDSSCKVSLQFKTRFWEHIKNPILGGCSYSDSYGIGQICFPSYNINSTGPAVILASYNQGDPALRMVSWTEERHVEHTLEYLAVLFGNAVYEQYTGKFNRKCWLEDPYIGASWADPSVGQHELYIPSYFNTENNIVFIGEHTSYTHAWIASALESSIRGTTQLLLELGLVDEAKMVTKEWMARWIHI